MGGWMDGWLAGWVGGWVDGWMDGSMDGWMDFFFPHTFFCQHLSTGTVLVLVIAQQICISCWGGAAINPEPRGLPQGRRGRRDAGGWASGWCSSWMDGWMDGEREREIDR